jgi:hypothetical protein
MAFRRRLAPDRCRYPQSSRKVHSKQAKDGWNVSAAAEAHQDAVGDDQDGEGDGKRAARWRRGPALATLDSGRRLGGDPDQYIEL